MKAAGQTEIKKTLEGLSPKDLRELILRMSRFKKENKELLTYLLFEMQQEEVFVEDLKQEMNEEFSSINDSNLYLVKKSLRKILRHINKHSRYSNLQTTAIALQIHFLEQIKERCWIGAGSAAIDKLVATQLHKTRQLIANLDEDLQADYGDFMQDWEK